MTRVTNPFDPFGFFAAGPLALFEVGLEIMQAWQRAWLPMLALPVRSVSAVGLPTPWKFAGFIPQVDARVTPSAAAKEATRLSMSVQLPGADERLSVEAEIARRQGRANAWLGCLQGAQVVYPETSAVAEKAPIDVPVLDAVVHRARTAKPKASLAAKAAPVKKATVKKTPATKAAVEKKAAPRATSRKK